MSEWKKVKLGDYINVLSGFAYKSKDFSDSGIPVIKIKNVCPPYISLEDLSFVPNSIAFQNPRYILKKGDVLIAMTGSHINQIASVVGRVGRVRYDDITVLNQRVGKIVNKNDDRSSLDYIYYFLSQYEVKVELAQKAGGAANQANISPSDIKDLLFPCPPIEVQNKIATILSRYDSLIENYQKQIKLLEEAAQRLYKEWFVDLHFPGYENTKIVDGVPEGWEKKTAKDFFMMSIGKTPPRAEKEWFTTCSTDVPWVSISDMKDVMFVNETNEHLTKDACEKFNVKIVPEGTILLSFKLTVGRVSIADIPVCTNEAIAHFRKDGTNWREYTLLFLRDYHYDSLGNTSGISKAVNSTIIKNMPFMMPSENVLNDFSYSVSPLFNNIKNLSSQIRLLIEARDRLLPKLMDGEIEV
jgi:type I restriction enzyme S subunit